MTTSARHSPDRGPARRPPDRRERILRQAAELFHRHGYHGVAVNDIASAAGITGPALYRHFASKQQLLAQVLRSGVEGMCAAAEQELGRDTPAARLSGLTSRFAWLAVEHRAVSALWRWEGRHLSTEDAAYIRRRSTSLLADWAETVRAVHPELSTADAELRCWAALSVLGSVADHRQQLPKRRFTALLTALCDRVLAAPPHRADTGTAPAERTAPVTPPLRTRREQLLTSATALFRERGFHAVSMEDIGQACGLAAASVYRHFPGKTDLLVEACKRMADRLAQSLAGALSTADSPVAALHGLLDSYVDTVLRHRDLLTVYVGELGNLPRRERGELIRLQRAYVDRWVELLGSVDGHAKETTVRIAVHATLAVVNDLARTERLHGTPGLAGELVGIGGELLRTPLPAPAG